jgi:nucleotide-binding universal stress UspA family protein
VHLLVGYDDSPESELALHRGFRAVDDSRFALIHVVSVVRSAGGGFITLPSGGRLQRYAALEMLRHTIETLFTQWELKKPQLHAVAHIVDGDPAAALVDFAYRNHVEQIVLGVKRRHQGGAHVGSVAEKVLTLSDIPVHLETALSSSPPRMSASAQSASVALGDQLKLLPKLTAWRKPASA